MLRLAHVADWRALGPRRAASFCAAMIRQPESWTARAIFSERTGHDWQWMLLHNELGAETADSVDWLRWTKTVDAERRLPREMPEPRPRPAVDAIRERQRADSEIVLMDTDELDAFLSRPRLAIPAQTE